MFFCFLLNFYHLQAYPTTEELELNSLEESISTLMDSSTILDKKTLILYRDNFLNNEKLLPYLTPTPLQTYLDIISNRLTPLVLNVQNKVDLENVAQNLKHYKNRLEQLANSDKCQSSNGKNRDACIYQDYRQQAAEPVVNIGWFFKKEELNEEMLDIRQLILLRRKVDENLTKSIAFMDQLVAESDKFECIVEHRKGIFFEVKKLQEVFGEILAEEEKIIKDYIKTHDNPSFLEYMFTHPNTVKRYNSVVGEALYVIEGILEYSLVHDNR